MIDEIFDEIFGKDGFYEVFNKISKNFYDEFKELEKEKDEKVEKDEKDEKDESYYHKIYDKYEDGKHTNHIEKEIKNGKVLKDINENYKLEDKSKCCKENVDNSIKNTECSCENKIKCCENSKDTVNDYEEQLKEAIESLGKANSLLAEAQKTISMQNDIIDEYKQQLYKMEAKLNRVKNLIDEK